MIVLLACALAGGTCKRVWTIYTDCPDAESETVPPCPEAGADDAGQDACSLDGGPDGDSLDGGSGECTQSGGDAGG